MAKGGRIRRTWPQRLLLGFNALLVVACLAAAGGLYTFKDKIAGVETIAIDSPTAAPVEVSEPRNILIIGTDSAANLDEDDPVNTGREDERLADVIMVMRIDPADGTARLLSFPRDTRVEVAPGGGFAKINSAMAGVDGERDLINTIKRNFGISIDNYVEIDFAAFKDLVDQLGGVPVYFAAPVRDKKSGLFIETPGCVLLDSTQALAYARSRAFQYQDSDGDWRYDQTGDLGRITRQQDFIKRAMRRASDKGIRNPGTALGIVDAATQSVLMDETLSVGTILDLVDVFRTFNPDDLQTDQIPTYGETRGEVAYQEVRWEESGPLLIGFWGYDDELQLDPADIIVDVEGPSSRSEAVDLVVTALDGAGFDADAAESRQYYDDLTITYGPAGFDAALDLATYMVDTPELEFDEDIVGPRLVVSLPENFGGLLDTPRSLDELPAEMQERPDALREFEAEAAADAGDAATGEQEELDQGAAAEVEAAENGTEDSTTTLPVDEDPAFIEAAEAEGAPPGIVPTDPIKAAACH